MKDVIEDVLETVRFKSAVYFKHGFCGNWGMDVSPGDYAQFHFIAGGTGILEIDEKTINLSRGDLVIFPRGKAHKIKANHKSVCLPGESVVLNLLAGNDPFAEGGEISSNLVCGHFELDRTVSHFILSDLPEYILIKNDSYGRFDLLDNILNTVIDELAKKQLGHQTIIVRFAEILFVSILRHHYLNKPSSNSNLFKDEAIYMAVNYIHNNLNSKLTIESLSRSVGISRTLFIDRFKRSVGDTPLSYIKEWRMSKAKQLLIFSDLPLREISNQIGYNSPSAFNRVFKNTFNISPNRFRNTNQGAKTNQLH